MLTVLSIIGVYIIGVVVSIVMVAYVNAKINKFDVIPAGACLLSWLLIALLLITYLFYPFELFYDWCYSKFNK